MKKTIALVIMLCILMTLCSCGSGLYYNYDLTKYITVGEYSNEVDTKSNDYLYSVNQRYASLFQDELSYDATEGIVENGETVNINFVGYLDGKEFAGGSAENYELSIGAGNFIDGFEDGLIGVEIGSTVDLNLNFPNPYPQNTELSGKPVVFRVTINSAKRYNIDDENIKDFGYESVKEFESDTHMMAVRNCMFRNVYKETSIIKYPDKEVKRLLKSRVAYYKKSIKSNGGTFKEFLSSNNMTEKEFKKQLEENYVKPDVVIDLLCYYILQINGQKLTEEDVEAKRTDLIENLGENLKNYGYDEFDIQRQAALDKAFNILADEAMIK